MHVMKIDEWWDLFQGCDNMLIFHGNFHGIS